MLFELNNLEAHQSLSHSTVDEMKPIHVKESHGQLARSRLHLLRDLGATNVLPLSSAKFGCISFVPHSNRATETRWGPKGGSA